MNPIEKEILAVDGFNQSIRADQTCFGTITRNAGADLKRNGQGVIEIVSRPHGSNKGGVVKSDTFPTVRKSATMDGNTGIVEPTIKVMGNYSPSKHSAARVVNAGGLAPTVMESHGTVTAVAEHNERFFSQALKTVKENSVSCGDTINAFNESVDKTGVSPTVTTRPEGFKTAILPVDSTLRIRKLTPRECGRLMGVRDDDIDKMSVNQSNSALYHCFGDSIVVDVLMAIFKQMI